MKLNIFQIPKKERDSLLAKLKASGLESIHKSTQHGWSAEFFYAKKPGGSVAWAANYKGYFDKTSAPTATNPYAAYVFIKGDQCYVVSHGKSHFYIRPYCDYDFGIELAKRIANERNCRQTASRRFQGRRKKDIRSFAPDTALDVQSGESVEYLQAGVIAPGQATFGKTGKFGASALLTVDVIASEIGAFLNKIDQELKEKPRFSLPRTSVVTDDAEIEKLDELLLDELSSDIGTTQFTHDSYDLYGVDFIFSDHGTFTLSRGGSNKVDLESLSVADLKKYIADHKIARADILRIRVTFHPEDAASYSRSVKEVVDFIADGDDKVLLTGGKWMRFNQDYLDWLDAYLAGITVEETESEFKEIWDTEPVFNGSAALKKAGYVTADKDFSKIKTGAKAPTEAWDLQKETRVYAVKFGTPQKLNYVVDQATSVLELVRNDAGVKALPEFDSYCLWLGYRGTAPLADITKSGSVILKQKIANWAAGARELGIEPVLKLSHKLKKGVDDKK